MTTQTVAADMTLGAAVQKSIAAGGRVSTGLYDLVFVDQSANGGTVTLSRLGMMVLGVGILTGLGVIVWRVRA